MASQPAIHTAARLNNLSPAPPAVTLPGLPGDSVVLSHYHLTEGTLSREGARLAVPGQPAGALQNLIRGRGPEHLLTATGPAGTFPLFTRDGRGRYRATCGPGQHFLVSPEAVQGDLLITDLLTVCLRLETNDGVTGPIARFALTGPKGAGDLSTLRLDCHSGELSFRSEHGRETVATKLPWTAGREGVVILQWDGRQRRQTLFVKQGTAPLLASPPVRSLAVGKQSLSAHAIGFLEAPATPAAGSLLQLGDIVIYRGLIPAVGNEILAGDLLK